METSRLLYLLLIWMVAVGIVALARQRRGMSGVGLTLAYLLNLWLIHWFAVTLYLIPGFRNNDPRAVELGFEQSVYAVVAFAFGSVVLAPFILNLGIFHKVDTVHELDSKLPRAYLLIGVLSYLSLGSLLSRLPSITALLAVGQQLVVVGLGLCLWHAWREKNYRTAQLWLLLTLTMPFITIVTRGFIGYGAMAAFSVLIFASSFIRSRVLVLVFGIILGYIGLSVYVTYMRDRGEIREVVWGGQSLRDRIDRVTTTVENFEWFDPSKDEHLFRVDDRLNQSYLVGMAVNRLTELGGYARGETLWDALLALIPRALWPDKPITAGSGNLVSEFTGIQYAAGTSVGIGQVMEFYVNFGTLGVIIGFTVMGILISLLDTMASAGLAHNDLHSFVLWYLPGLSLLQVGGSMIEITTSAVASIVVALLVNRYLARLQQKQAEKAPGLPMSMLLPRI